LQSDKYFKYLGRVIRRHLTSAKLSFLSLSSGIGNCTFNPEAERTTSTIGGKQAEAEAEAEAEIKAKAKI